MRGASLLPAKRTVVELARSLRDGVARQLARAPFDSMLFGPPRHAVDSLVSWLAAHPEHGTLLRVESAARSDYGAIEITEPHDDPLRLSDTRSYQHPEVFVARIRAGRIVGSVPTVVAPGDTVVRESLHCVRQYWSWTDVHRRVWLPRVQDVPKAVVTLPYALSTGLHEWLLYSLPRLRLAEEAGLDPRALVLVPAAAPPWLEPSLAMVGVSRDRLLPFPGRAHWRIASLIVPSVPSERPLPWVCAWLRDMARRAGWQASERDLRIYVSRRSAVTRRVVNEDEVVAFLAARGFRSVDLSTLPFPDQVRLLSGAQVIVGPHGAGLTHCVFAQPGCLVAEFFEQSYVYPCFYWTAGASGHRYRYLLAETVKQRGHVGGHGFDMRVSIPALERLLAGAPP